MGGFVVAPRYMKTKMYKNKIARLRRKYNKTVTWAKNEGIVRSRGLTNDEELLEAIQLFEDKISEFMDEAIEQFPFEIAKPVIEGLDKCSTEIAVLAEYLEQKVY